jgi:hypothetical protein
MIYTSYKWGQISQQIEAVDGDRRTMQQQMGQFLTATEQLSVNLASVSAQLSGLRDALTQERQDRLNFEHDQLYKGKP